MYVRINNNTNPRKQAKKRMEIELQNKKNNLKQR